MQPEADELALRIDAIGQALLLLTAELERSNSIDGPHYSTLLRSTAQARGARPGLARCGAVLHELAARLEDARAHRLQAPRG